MNQSAIGWGSLVVTSKSYLSQAGPMVILLVALLCIKSKRATAKTMVGLVLLFTAGITFCFVAAMIGHGHTDMTMKPDFVSDSSAFRQVLRITRLSTD